MSAPASDKFTDQGECGGGSNSDDLLSVVIESPPPSPQPQPCNVWLSSIMKEGGAEPESSNNAMPNHKIPKVPKMLRQVDSNKKCYEPEVVSIGPYHHGKTELEPMVETLKIRFTREYVKSCKILPSSTESVAAPELLLYNKVADVAGDARKCYDEESTKCFDETAFTQMMFLDGCFILQFIHYICTKDEEEQAKMKMKSHDVVFVRRDLFLLENQLPFKVLQALMSMNSEFDGNNGLERINEFIRTTRASPPKDSFLEKMENFITKYITDRKRRQQPESNSVVEPAHLLEVMHRQLVNPNTFKIVDKNKTVPANKGEGGCSCYSYSQHKWARLKQRVFKQEQGDNNSWYSYRSVQELKAAGIQFRPNKESSFFTDARYEPQFIRAILRLPPMTIDESTQSLLLNLVAYEMCPDTPDDFGVTSYISFMDTLIDQADDVKELRKKDIILNYLGSDDEVARLFNEIAKNLVPNPQVYENVNNQIEKHYKNRVILWMTEWLYTHFSTPWAILAFLAAILAIALSFVQTYYAVHPNSGN